jgi:TolA-binding protein
MQWSLFEENKFDAAMQLADLYIDKKPNSDFAAHMQFNKAEFCEEARQFDRAAASYELVCDKYPASPSAQRSLYRAGQCYEKLKQDKKAYDTYELQVKKFPQSEAAPAAMFRCGEIRERQTRADEARKQYDGVIAAYPRDFFAAQARYRIGLMQLKENEATLSERSFNLIMQDFDAIQTLALAHLGLGKVAMARGDMAAARAQLVMVIDSGNRIAAAEAQYLLGETYAQGKNDEQAAVEFLKVKYLYADYAEWVAPALLQAAQAKERQNLFAEARGLYKTIIEEHPFAAGVAGRAKERLEALAGK